MEWILGVLCILFFVLFLFEYIRFQRQKKNMVRITEELDQFFYCPIAPHTMNLDEGYFANMYNQIAKLEEQVLKVEKNSKVREQEMTVFIENMAHQIKNVLTAMQIQLDLLDNCSSEKAKGYLEKCQNSMSRLTWEIDRLLKSSQLAEGKITMINEPMNLVNETREVIKGLKSISDKKNITVILESVEDVIFSGDSFWISQAIENLIKNAIEHSVNGGQIKVYISKKHNMGSIRVEDSGSGILESEMENLFRRFYRGNINKSGYGIGLSMVRDIATAHHGNVKAGNNINGGAWFELNLLCIDNNIYNK